MTATELHSDAAIEQAIFRNRGCSRVTIGALIIGDEILSGKRRNKHLAHLIDTLGARGLKIDWARYEGDDRGRLTATLRQSFATGDIVFSFGGVGATPDDHTRQAAAAALGVALVRHPEAVTEIEAQFGAAAYPNRILMAEFPAGSRIIPNPVNRVASFSVRDHHFFPGFPQMAWPMLDWVLATHYAALAAPPEDERAIIVHDAGESQLLPLMNDNVARFPQLKLFCLPSFVNEGRRRLELGVRGDPALLDAALAHLTDGVESAGFRWEPLAKEGSAATS
jgi:molybdopterin-biosynthesis enzyme MoeA-like protein